MIININIPSYTYYKYTISLLGHMIIHRIHQLIMHHIARIFQLVKHFHKSLEMLITQNAFYIFYYKELGLLGLDEINVSQEHLASFIIQAKLLSTFAPRLARRSADDTINIIREIRRRQLPDISLNKMNIGEVGTESGANLGINFICYHYPETSYLEA